MNLRSLTGLYLIMTFLNIFNNFVSFYNTLSKFQYQDNIFYLSLVIIIY